MPLGTQTFSEIITRNMVYADKTQYIFDLIRTKKACFLSRPRRFGKSLLISTMYELFSGNKDLFKDTWIYNTDYDFKKYPILRFKMNYSNIINNNDLIELIYADVIKFGSKYNINITQKNLGQALDTLIESIFEITHQKLVILVDEYDAPITKYLNNLELAESNSLILHDFYTTLKNNDEFIKFIFVTGITRFSLTYFDSGPNNLIDITLHPKFEGICGFTIDEFDSLFEKYIDKALKYYKNNQIMQYIKNKTDLRNRIIDYYNGYSWGGSLKILNPYSIVNFFDTYEFLNYWYNIGRPKYLSKLIQEKPWEYIRPELDKYISDDLSRVNIGSFSPGAILFQSGYLTIDKKIVQDNNENHHDININIDGEGEDLDIYYKLKIPNFEIEKSYRKDLLKTIFKENIHQALTTNKSIYNALLLKDYKELETIFSSIFASVSYLQQLNDIEMSIIGEKHFHALIQVFLQGKGFKIFTEMTNYLGRSDLIVELEENIFVIIEIKYIKSETKDSKASIIKLLNKTASEGLEQISNHKYSEPFKNKINKIIEMSMAIYGRGHLVIKFA
ncbi:MAG: ATP-binding protein [Deltaproteobacteria bacterium]|nr:ATP-binding protein [Deltaproteobacteria bacterium]